MDQILQDGMVKSGGLALQIGFGAGLAFAAPSRGSALNFSK